MAEVKSAAENPGAPNKPFVPTDFSDREVLVTRVIRAPRDLVFAAYTDPDHISNWWGPVGFRTTTREMNVAPGGHWRFTMHGPDGTGYLNHIIYEEVVAGKRLVYAHAGEEEHADISFRVTVTFEPVGPGGQHTKLTMRSQFPSAAARERVIRDFGATEGGLDTMERLSEHLAGQTGERSHRLIVSLPSPTEIVLRRTFDAPRELLFEVMSSAQHLRKWWAPRSMTIVTCEADFRVGGSWRIVHRDPGGTEYPFCGEYREIVPPEKIVQTFIYDAEGARDYPSLETMTLAERDGKTVLTTRVEHANQMSRDMHLNSGMEPGASEIMDRLAELVGSLK